MKKQLLVLVTAAAVLMGTATRSSAFSFSIYDNGTDNIPPATNPAAIWTLTIAEGCTTCAATLSVQFTDLSPNPYYAQAFYLDSVQFSLNNTSMTGVTDTGTNAGTIADWNWGTGSLSANQCGAQNPSQSACGGWATSAAPGGFLIGGAPGPHTYSWNVNVTFDQSISAFTTGNIRAAFNAVDGSNLRIFSPGQQAGGGGGGGAGGGAGQTIPEPAMLGLFGMALAFGASRLRRR
jgi:hypothetical protein